MTEAGDQPDASGHPEEVELKYRVLDPAAGARWLDADAVGPLAPTAKRPQTVDIEDRYVDTADGALARAGLAVRFRRRDGQTIVSVKSLARTEDPGGAVRRLELEAAADPTLPPTAWPESDARMLVVEHAGDQQLVDRVVVRQRRQKRNLRRDGDRVELSLDTVDVLTAAGEVAARWTELELELRKGDAAVLADAAGVLDADPGLARSAASKLESALAALAAPAGPDATEARLPAPPGTRAPDETLPLAATSELRSAVGKSPGVVADDHVAEAARKVLRFHLARMLDLADGAGEGDVNAVHKMRVATRRQRAAWRIFGPSFRTARTKRYRNGLRETASRLGAVRDMDVLLDAADAYRADLPTTEQRALEPLLTAWRNQRAHALVLLAQELASDRHRRWLQDYIDFLDTEGAATVPVGPVQPHRIRDTAGSRIWGAYEGVRAYEPVLRWADVETLHELRIAGKWLRYSLEFVREALGPDANPLIAKVTALQDHLGLMHDADVEAGMARAFLVDHAGDLSALESAAIGRYLVDREREVVRLRRTVGGAWRGVTGLRYRRVLGRVISGL